MLEQLHVKNIALISEVDIVFSRGLHILSGETGAGKSILLGALHLALGGRAGKDMLRHSKEEALVEAVFRVTTRHQKDELKRLGVEDCGDEVILTRKLTETRSIAKINGEMVPAVRLKQVGEVFLDICGQQEHQSLTNPRRHLELLDEFARAEVLPQKEAVKEAFLRYEAKKKEWESSQLNEAQRLREMSFLEHEIHEIEEAGLLVGEDDTLEADFRRLGSSRRIMDALSLVYQNTSGVSELMGRSIRELHGIGGLDASVDDFQIQLGEIDSLLGDFNRDVSQYMADAEFDEEAFTRVQLRLNEVNRLKDKYGQTVEDVLAALEEKKTRLKQLQSYETYQRQLKKELDECQDVLEARSGLLSQTRKSFAGELGRQMQQALLHLNFLDVAFDIKFERLNHYTKDGFDYAEFMLRTNPGEPMKPLKDIASGGELSRVMLAFKTVLAKQDEVRTLIFDEIDAGISGRTAQAVSEKLNLAAKEHQVICITHLPQIAAMADCHYLIEKEVVEQETVSSIRLLSRDESIRELARMLGGTEITQRVLENAKEMKELAQQQKQQV